MDNGKGDSMSKESSNGTDQQDAFGNSRAFQQRVVGRASTQAHATHYNMGHKYRGFAIIFNHEHFKVSGLKQRSGTAVDCMNIADRLKSLGFNVKTYHDRTFGDINNIVREAAATDHSECDCFLMVVLSHGEMGILYSHDDSYKPDYLWSPFTADRCPSLAGKPKMFFIQACQGDKLDGGIHMMSRTETDGQPTNDVYRIPTQADFLIAYSTVPGYYSWRNTTRGSWFMQALCEELEQSAYDHDILTLMTFVNRRVAIDYESNTPGTEHMHQQKQIPCITSMLTRLLLFNKKGYRKIEAPKKVQTKERHRSIMGTISGAFRTQSRHSNSV